MVEEVPACREKVCTFKKWRSAGVVELVPICREKVCTWLLIIRRSAGVVELARLESVYTSKGYQGFESLLLRKWNRKFFMSISFKA